ncbi:hypothetical protein CsSME_00017047 [Camellia sinensis var. sinensis]
MRGGGRRTILIGLGLVMVLGIAVYLRLWVIDYRISSDEAELLRRQFDLANREAMEESAEWRFKYDEEVKKASNCAQELNEVHNEADIGNLVALGLIGFNPSLVVYDKTRLEMKQSLEKPEGTASINKELEMLQKENIGLLERVESLKQELEGEKLKCNAQ